MNMYQARIILLYYIKTPENKQKRKNTDEYTNTTSVKYQ